MQELVLALPGAGADTQLAAEEMHELLLDFERTLSGRERTVADVGLLYQANRLLYELPEAQRPASYSARERFGFLRAILVETGFFRDELLRPISVRVTLLNQVDGYHAEVRRVVAEDLAFIEEPKDRFDLLLRAAQSAIAMGDFDAAERGIAQAEEEIAGQNAPILESRLLTGKTELHRGLGLLDEAVQDVTQHLALLPELPVSYRARAQRHYCEILLAVGQAERASARIEQLLAEDGLFGDFGRAQLLSILGIAQYVRALWGELPPSVARATLLVVADMEELPVDDRELALLSLAELELAEDELERSDEWLGRLSTERAGRRPEFHARLAALRHRRASHGNDEEEKQRAYRDLVQSWQSFLESWRSVQVRGGGVGFLEFGPRRVIASELVRATIARYPGEAGRFAALQHVLEAQELGHFARSAGYRPTPLGDVLDELTDASSGLLVFLSGHRATHVFALDAEEIVHAEIPGPHVLREAAAPWLDELNHRPRRDRSPKRADVHALGEPLAKLLFPAEVRERIASWDAVTVIGLAFLRRLPLECLPFGAQSAAESLGTSKAISQLPSMPVGMVLRERSLPEKGELDLVLLAAPKFSPQVLESVEAIPYQPEHAERLTRGFASERVLEPVRDEATRTVLLDPRLETAALLHLFTHGVSLTDRSRTSALALAPTTKDDSGVLDCEFVENHVAAPPVVLLSACRAGAGRTRWGDDGPAHLGGAFLAAGAQVVVLSPVALELVAQSRFAEHFQLRLLAGDSVREAARAARAALAKRSGTEHPYFGRVIVLGDGDVRPFAQVRGR